MNGVAENMSKPIVVNDSNFDEVVLKAKTPVLIDFWAPWCAPCRFVAPIVEELADEYDGRVTFCKLNCDEAPSLAGQFGIRAIPTLLLFKDGKPASSIVGLRPKAELKRHIEQALR